MDSDSSDEEKHILTISDIIAEKIAQERMQTFSDVVDKVAEELAQERSKPFAGDRTTLSDKFEFLRSFEGDDKLFDIVQAFASKEERRRRVIAAAKRRRAKLIEKRNKKRVSAIKKK